MDENMKFKPKEYYREKIIEIVNKINNYWILDQIYQFIQNMTKGS